MLIYIELLYLEIFSIALRVFLRYQYLSFCRDISHNIGSCSKVIIYSLTLAERTFLRGRCNMQIIIKQALFSRQSLTLVKAHTRALSQGKEPCHYVHTRAQPD